MTDKYKWSSFPDTKPIEPGYYMTFYYNSNENCHLFKAIYWNNKWHKWNKRVEIENQVKHFLLDSRNDYYVPCTIWCQDNAKYIEKINDR
jgi:hypothetical protein